MTKQTEAIALALEKFAKVKALCDKHGAKLNRNHVYGGALIEHFDVVCQALTAQQAQQQEPGVWKETDEVECPVCRDRGFPWPKCGHVTYLEHSDPPAPRQPLTVRELELIDGMIEVQLDHALRCDSIGNRAMADKQKAWDMERVELLRKLKAAHGIKEKT